MSAYGGKGYMQSSAKQAAFYSHEQGQVGHQHHHHQQHVSYAPHTAHGHSSSTKHQQKFHYTPQTKPPQETLTFADSKGMSPITEHWFETILVHVSDSGC